MSQPTIPTFDPVAQRQVLPAHMVMCVNAIDRDVTFEIGGTPGSPPTEFTLRPGDRCSLPKSFARPIKGAGRDPREPILYMLTACEAYPGGPRIQAVVPEDEAAKTSEAWAKAKASRPKVATVMLTDSVTGQQVPMAIPTPHEPEAPRRGGGGKAS